MLIGLGFIQFAKTETKASIAYGLGLVGKLILDQKYRISERNWVLGTFLKYLTIFSIGTPGPRIMLFSGLGKSGIN